MESNARTMAYDELAKLADKQGYVTFDDVMDISDEHSLSLQDFDWLSSSLTSSGILVYDNVPHKIKNIDKPDDEYDDYAQIDYDVVYKRIIELEPSLKFLVDTVKNILPPQYKEISQLKYQVVEGNEYARKRMIEMHLRIALRIALQRAESYDDYIGDLIGNAIIGLIYAVDKYDPDLSGAFSSYATLWIIQNISREQNNKRPIIYYPAQKKDDYYYIYPFAKHFGCVECDIMLKCEKFILMIMEKKDCNKQSAEDVVVQISPGLSLDFEMFDNESEYDRFCLSNQLYLEDDYLIDFANKSFIREHIQKDLNALSLKEKKIITERYGLDGNDPRTLEQIGNEMNVTRERVRQIESKGLLKLKRLIEKYYSNEII